MHSIPASAAAKAAVYATRPNLKGLELVFQEESEESEEEGEEEESEEESEEEGEEEGEEEEATYVCFVGP